MQLQVHYYVRGSGVGGRGGIDQEETEFPKVWGLCFCCFVHFYYSLPLLCVVLFFKTEEIDAVMKSGGADQMITQAMLKVRVATSSMSLSCSTLFRCLTCNALHIRQGADQAVKNVFANVAQKYEDVLTLEASIAELHQMFVDFSLLVEQQGALVDRIEYQVHMA